MYTLQVKSKRIVFSHETALYLHELTDRDPLEWSVTIPAGYNGSNLREAGIKVYTVKKELHLIGVTELKTLYGRSTKVYDKERTICDIVRNRNNMDVAILNEGIKRYLYNKDKNILLKLQGNNIDKILLSKAVIGTSEKRGSLNVLSDGYVDGHGPHYGNW